MKELNRSDVIEYFAKILLRDIRSGADGPARSVSPAVFTAISRHTIDYQQSRYQEVIIAYEAWKEGRVAQGLFISQKGTITYR